MPEPGAVLGGRYRLDERIGAGGMGEVWRATDQRLDRTVAVKLMRPGLLADAGLLTRFRNEARVMASIEHSGVVAVHDFHDEAGTAFLVMAYVDGTPVSQLLAGAGRLPAPQAMELMAQAADALHAAHNRGVVHRDVKPANLLLRPDGTVVLTDFGIARVLTGDELTATGVVLGTVSYLAPEQVLGEPVTARTDVYALGLVAYECLAGARPFEADIAFASAMARVRQPAPYLAEAPYPVAEVVARALAREPADRWASAADLAAACRSTLAQLPPPDTAAPPTYVPPGSGPYGSVGGTPTPTPPPVRRRTRYAVAGGAAALLVAVLVIGTVAIANLSGGYRNGDSADPNDNAGVGGDTGAAPAPSRCVGDGLHLGTILPHTGTLALLGPPLIAGVDAALDEINTAGGVLGECATATHTDSGDMGSTVDRGSTVAARNAELLVAEGVHAVVGAASSMVSLQFIDILHEAGISQVSPSNTSPALSAPRYDHHFRTAASDVLQGRVLADLALQDGNEDVALFAIDDEYGRALLDHTAAAVERGGAAVVLRELRPPDRRDFSATVDSLRAADPDAIVFLTYDSEFEVLAPQLAAAELGVADTDWYLSDAALRGYGDDLADGILAGAKGIVPASDPEPLRPQLLAADPELVDLSYGPEAYDAAILIALAAVAAKAYDPGAIRNHLIAVSRDGIECSGFAECRDLLVAGEAIDYSGASGPIDWDDNGDPTSARFGVFEYDADNLYVNVRYVTSAVD